MTGRATGAGPCHPHYAAERRLIGRHNGRFHLGLSDLQAVANHFLGAEAFLLHGLTTDVASVRLNLSSRGASYRPAQQRQPMTPEIMG